MEDCFFEEEIASFLIVLAIIPELWFMPGCKEYKKVPSLEGIFKKNAIQDMYHNNSNNLEATFVKLSENV